MQQRLRIQVDGIVQGVGFRPFVFRLAQALMLSGFVQNGTNGVLIEIEGEDSRCQIFQHRLRSDAPAIAQIIALSSTEIPLKKEPGFEIITSSRDAASSTIIPPDIAICNDCRHELFDPQNRHFHYPFINCTNCGPRYTITGGIPYDRPLTSMEPFPMCDACSAEYHDPQDRRFHAQPNACRDCGPQIWFENKTGGSWFELEAVLKNLKISLKKGHILAIRGLGGFHLVCDAHHKNALKTLRERKRRAEKPFALMAANFASIEKYCFLSENEKVELVSPAHPIVLLSRKTDVDLPTEIAPKSGYLGFMLPYLPLQFLLFELGFELLVMTSANFSDEPIVISNDIAGEELAPIVDGFVFHNREILQRCDDSIVKISGEKPRVLRRARGFVPSPILLKKPVSHPILAVGAELKNTIALARGNRVVLSQHIGDLDTPSALTFFHECIAHLQHILVITPEVIVCDQHPEYLSTKWAKAQAGVAHIEVQHHHAHLAAVMAENHVEAPCIGIILDGTGLGSDGTIWGGEILIGDYHNFERFAWFKPVLLPGGEAAIREPWRMAVSYLHDLSGNEFKNWGLALLKSKPHNQLDLLSQILVKKINTPLTSSCGRLFDAVSALLGIREKVTYEAQAAIELEMCVREKLTRELCYQIDCSGKNALPTNLLFQAVLNDVQEGSSIEKIAARFHASLVEILVYAAIAARKETSINRVGLSGGVFQNFTLFEYLLKRLKQENFEVFSHSKIPTNDGGVSLGQVAIAGALL